MFGKDGNILLLPAASVIVAQTEGDSLRFLLMRRAAHLAFAPGAYVFPGGRLNDGEEAALAAAREAYEEANLLFAVDSSGSFPDAAALADFGAARQQIAEGRLGFLDFLRVEGLALRLDLFTPHARWITPEGLPRRFDTRFFLARAPSGQTPDPDLKECDAFVWLTAEEALAAAQAGALPLMFPTLMKLMRLKAAASWAEALALGDDSAVMPYLVPDVSGRMMLRLSDDAPYPVRLWPLEGLAEVPRQPG